MIPFPTTIEVAANVFVAVRDGGLCRFDDNPGAFCPAQTCFDDQANFLVLVALLSPQLLGGEGQTPPERRAQWAYQTSYARRFLQRTLPALKARLAALGEADAVKTAIIHPGANR